MECNKKCPTQTTKKPKKRICRSSESTSSESSIEPLYEETDDDLDFLDEEQADEMLANFKLNAWVLVKYCSKKTIKYYAGKILEINKVQRECVVKFLRFNEQVKKFVWPKTDDIDTIIYENVEMFLPDPIETEEHFLEFTVEFSGLTIA